MDTLISVSKELKIPSPYLKRTSRKDRVFAVVQRSWLNNLVKTQSVPDFIHHESLSPEEVQAWVQQGDDLGVSWSKVLVKVFVKGQKNVIPLPRPRPLPSKSEPDLSFAQVLHYVSQTNHKNLWKEAFKKYLNGSVPTEEKTNPALNFVSCESVMRDIIQRMYGCPIIRIDPEAREQAPESKGRRYEAHCNVLPAICAVETCKGFFVIHRSHVAHTVQDCVTFSPALLGSSSVKPLFIIYQLLQAMRDLHDRGLILGDISFSDVLVSDNLWIQIVPHLEDNVHDEPRPKCRKKSTVTPHDKSSACQDKSVVSQTCNRCSPCDMQRSESNDHKKMRDEKVAGGFSTDRKLFRCDSDGVGCELKRLCELWVYGQLSNFDYLMALNEWAGRKYGDPTGHYVMPWVTDFSHRSGVHWRDLSRSKYRLNKGDKQLDLTYDTAVNGTQVSHHVSDVLSEITYYVYLARRTPKSVLCKYVRTRWVPAEYPSSIQRLQAWTPDECIPEFFTDPTVFQSIHDDLPDLEVPSWARSVRDFVDWHRDALESMHVSERLHHWIDLTFGYKLSGAAAIKAKNVCLQLVDGHMRLASAGVVQLFTHPHPQRLVPSPYWGKAPPRLLLDRRRVGDRMSEDDGVSSGFEEDEVLSVASQSQSRSSPLAFSRLLSRSRGSLQVSSQSSDDAGSRPPGAEPQKQVANGLSAQTIFLPKDFNPTAAIQSVELQHSFLVRTFHQGAEPDWFGGWPRGGPTSNFVQAVACRRIREMQVLGCLIVELFLGSKLHALGSCNLAHFDQRLEACHSVMQWHGDNLSHCVKHVVSRLLRPDLYPPQEALPFRYPPVTRQGLPPPSAHQLLQPLLFPAVLPFPRYFTQLFRLLETLGDYEGVAEELEGDAHARARLAECRVKTCARELAALLPHLCAEGLAVLLPHVTRLLQDPATCVLAAWHLFDPVAAALGPRQTAELLLPSVIALYDHGDDVSTLSCLKLYHHSFLLQLVVRLGLAVFLQNFVTPLVEAVGGYSDVGHGGATLQSRRVTGSHLGTCDIEESMGDIDGDQVLSPIEEDFSAESDHRTVHQQDDHCKESGESMLQGSNENKDDNEPELLEDGKASPMEEEARLYNIIAHLDLNIPHAAGETDTDDVATSHCSQDETLGIAVEDSAEQSEDLAQDQPAGDGDCAEQPEAESLLRDDGLQGGNSYCKVSDMGADSVLWLSHRLGPVLTARHLSRNLLRMLALCYLGRDNLHPVASRELRDGLALSVTNTTLAGDLGAANVVHCLCSITALYGEQLVLLQYLPHMADVVGLCRKKLTLTLESGLVGALSLLGRIIPYLSDASLMDNLQDVILKNILHPALRLLSTTKLVFPSGEVGRAALAAKCVDALYVIAQRIGQEMTKKHLLAPSLQRFFLAFDKAYEKQEENDAVTMDNGGELDAGDIARGYAESKESHDVSCGSAPADYLEKRCNGTSNTSARGSLVHALLRESDSKDLCGSPPFVVSDQDWRNHNPTRSKVLEELRAVFTPQLAHLSYLPFVMLLGDVVMEQAITNAHFINDLCFQYERDIQENPTSTSSVELAYLSDYLGVCGPQLVDKSESGNLGSNVSVVGNRIDLQNTDVPSLLLQQASSSRPSTSVPGDVVSLISKKMGNNKRHLRGNWLAYWEHEIGRAEKDTRFNFKQIKLQTFKGHTNSVRALHVLNNENSFVSGSRDKTVKLWSLRSQGDGGAVSHCQWTYTGHRKAVVGLTFVESVRLVASCDYGVHVWDPFLGAIVGTLESARHPQVNVLRALPPPSTAFLAATTDVVALRLVDARTCSFVSELRVSANPAGYIRCVTVGPGGTWVAVGQSTGVLTLLDVRTGMVVASWKGHEGEVLQLVTASDKHIISSSLDQTVSVWSAVDGRLLYFMKGPTEPVHCLGVYGSELISGTTANRIGVHTAVDEAASFSSTRLRSDTFRGVLTTMAVLPMNRLLLLGADSGNISLLC